MVLPEKQKLRGAVVVGGTEVLADRRFLWFLNAKRRIWFHVEVILVHAVEKTVEWIKNCRNVGTEEGFCCFGGPSVYTMRHSLRREEAREGDRRRWMEMRPTMDEADNGQNRRQFKTVSLLV
jgi:hypothetical protein